MEEIFSKSEPKICEALPSATSSPELESGAMPLDVQDGMTLDLFGREVVLAPPSRAQAKATGLMTLVISGRLGNDSSQSATLQRSLENSLIKQLDSAGSTLFKLTWRGKDTPLGRRYLEHAVSALRRSGSDCISVPRPTAMDYSRGGGKPPRPWDTGVPLTQIVALSSVARPSARDWKDSPGMSETGVDPDGSIRKRLDQLPRQAQLADSGATATGGTAKTANSGQLATDYSRWLVGLPTVWESCADMVTRSSRRKLKGS
jgi:hypothetical protein